MTNSPGPKRPGFERLGLERTEIDRSGAYQPAKDELDEKRIRRRARRAVALIALFWVSGTLILWCLPVSGVDGSTSYGLFAWRTTEASSNTRPGRLLLPRWSTRRHFDRVAPLAATSLAFAGLTIGSGVWGRRTIRNRGPRWRCQNCGHTVRDGRADSSLCPECGELPNLRRWPWEQRI